MTRTIRRATIAAALIATPILTIAGPALAASTAQPAAAGVVVANPGHPHGWDRKPVFRPTRPARPSTTKPAPSPTSSPAVPVPTSSPTTSPTTSPVTPNDFETQVVTLTNTERAKNGCGALRIDSRLVAAARAHSSDMVTNNFFSHTGSNGSDFVVREVNAGYPKNGASAENIAWGYRTPREVVTGWMNSAGHRANILNCSSIAVGVGTAYDADGAIYWTQNFGRV